jgi:hypothetical protein
LNDGARISDPLAREPQPRISESSFAVIGDMMPPRDPNDDEEDEDENSDDKEDLEPPVVREPDEE